MLEQWTRVGATGDDAVARRTLDRAEGVLMGVLGYDSAAAFMELVVTARDAGLRLTAISGALLDVASGHDGTTGAHDVVRERWGRLLPGRSGSLTEAGAPG
ncbi:ANTAR domain-containing protein [Mycolicibacterium sediminis]|uniref:ANTAR domain-containing protein n=1 Tax=Mycolicibacterium sediminis TaxID=1286180 RepID=UPI0013D79145|nr:ANTAR domain-containing protein [Mycolicibacterium sediminis]